MPTLSLRSCGGSPAPISALRISTGTLLLDDTRRAAHGEAAAPRRAVFRLTIKLALPGSAYVICDAVRPLPFSRSGEPQLRRLLASASLFLRRDSLLD